MEEITVNAGYIQPVEESGTSVLKLCTRRTPINQSIIYLNTLRQRAEKLVQNMNVYK